MPPKKIVYKKTTPLTKINKRPKNGAMALGLATITVCNETLQRNGIQKKTSVSGRLNFPEMDLASNSQKNAVNADLNWSNMLGIEGLDGNFKLKVSYNNLRHYKKHFVNDETQLPKNITDQEKHNNDNQLNSNCKQQTKQTNEPVGRLSQSNSTPNSFTVTRKNNYNEVNTQTFETKLLQNNNNRLQSNTGVVFQKPFPPEQHTEQSTQNKRLKLSKRCLPFDTEMSNYDKTTYVTNKETDETTNYIIAETGEPIEIEKITSVLKKSGTTLNRKKNAEIIRNNDSIIIMNPNLDQPMASSSMYPDVDIIETNQDISDESSNDDAEQDTRNEIHASDLFNGYNSQNNKLTKRTKRPFTKKASFSLRKGIKGNNTKHSIKNRECADCDSPSQNLTSNMTGNNTPPVQLEQMQTQLHFQQDSSIARHNFSSDIVMKINNQMKINEESQGVQSQLLRFRDEQCSQTEIREIEKTNGWNVQPIRIKTETENDTPNQESNSMNIEESNQRPYVCEYLDLTSDDD